MRVGRGQGLSVAGLSTVVTENLVGLVNVELPASRCWPSPAVFNLILITFRVVLTGFRQQARLQTEIIALRHQLTVLQRTPYPKRLLLNRTDRCFWLWLSRFWSGWRSALIIVKPETVIGWHRRGFQWYWTWKIRHGRPGRPKVPRETRELIRTMRR